MYFSSHHIFHFQSPNDQTTMCFLPQVTLDPQLRNWSHHCLYQVDYMVMIIWWWLWICWSWRLKWWWQWWETQVEMTVLIIKIHYVVLASDDQYRLSQDPVLRLPILRPVSPLCLTRWWWVWFVMIVRMVNDDECAVYLCVRVFCVWECVFFQILVSHWSNVKSHDTR